MRGVDVSIAPVSEPCQGPGGQYRYCSATRSRIANNKKHSIPLKNRETFGLFHR